jgi:hypothetical protein
VFFDSWYSVARVVTVGGLAYVAVVAVLRVSGKRTLAKLNAFDLVITVAFGSTLASISLSQDVALLEGAAAVALLAAAQFLVAEPVRIVGRHPPGPAAMRPVTPVRRGSRPVDLTELLPPLRQKRVIVEPHDVARCRTSDLDALRVTPHRCAVALRRRPLEAVAARVAPLRARSWPIPRAAAASQ